PRPAPALRGGGDGRPVPAGADDARLRPHGRRRDEAAPRSVHRGDARRRAGPVPRRGAAARAPRGRVRQLSDRRLSPHGRRHRAGRDDRARHDGGDRRRGGDPPSPRAHRDPGLRRRRPRAGAVRRVPPRVLRPLRGRLRPLRGLHAGDRRARAGRRGRLPRALRLRPPHVGRLPRPLRRRAARAPAAPGARADGPVTDVTASELLAVVAARELRDDTTVFAGVGVPLLAAALARQRHAPRLTLVIEGGIIGPEIAPGRLPVSTNEMRAGHRATMLPGITDAFLFAQRGFVDVGFMGGAQIDQYGNINTSVLGPDYWHPKVRLPVTGGANEMASLCREVIVVTPHEKRRFVERVDFVTSPAWLRGAGTRRAAGLLFGGVSRVVTTLGILGFEPDSKRMRIEATHPGVTADVIRQNTGFALLEAAQIETTEPQSDDELEMLRSLDPERRFLG